MTETVSILTLSIAGLAGLAMVTAAALAGWRGWLDLQRTALAGDHHDMPEPAPANTGARIELADLRERVRKLEAIAAGIDL
ncbi:hypothetical protein HZF05_19720 [Sphingomonas sp. CGMCC 1.13654]|uniref:Uncharacterized protein n=1 Tax=Sphingomonas chungangi TaxID=2683589 RepID=A0A838LBA5_9SPHN|nr:hypothetical protein [Sphingomonas chungangi]MBA2936317.1 hypothetical protein [Sphingomonas chungangi]MVW55702.1 hypothetical protein [Sphingomonas chungangi]